MKAGQCDGLVFRISAALVDLETEFMWRREMFSGSYRPVFLEVATPQGAVDALVFVMDQNNHRYMPELSEDMAARMIAVAEGGLGSNFAYLDALVQHLDELDITDAAINQLHVHASAFRAKQL